MMNSHNMEESNVSSPIQDSISETIRGTTESYESVSPEQLYLSEAFKPIKGGVVKEIDEGLSEH